MNKFLMALAGNPNAGKTTLFNHLTGARQHVGNYPGITVDYKEGSLTLDNQHVIITDLPGTYSLTAYSEEEVVARDYLINQRPKVVINIIDASNLERNLYLTCQFLELGIPIVIALNMIDVAKDRGIKIKAEKLTELLGVPVIPIIARNGQGTDELMTAAMEVARENKPWIPTHISYGEDLDETILDLMAIIDEQNFLTESYPSRYTAIKYLEHDDLILSKGQDESKTTAQTIESQVTSVSDHTLKTTEVFPESIIADHRYGFIKSILRQGIVTHTFDQDRLHITDRIDKVLTNRFFGPVAMLLILFGLYQFTFTWSEIPVGWMENVFVFLGDTVRNNMAEGPLRSMLISGVIDGVGGVLGFVPLIMFMFLGISILEDSGYLARVAFMMDRIFRIFGLHGSSVMPFIISGGIAGGCAVPGVMATRTMRSPKERMATLLTVPFMNCGAKVPVLALLIGAFFSDHKASYMMFFTLLAWLVALISAKILRSTVLKGAPTPFVMELPPYRFPTAKGLAIHTWERTWQYIKKAGTVILAFSVVLWAMMTYPGLPEDEAANFEAQRQAIMSDIDAEKITQSSEDATAGEELSTASQELQDQLTTIDVIESEAALRHSLAGQIGTSLEPISQMAGFEWRTNIALMGGFAAKEVIVSTLGTAYSMGEIEADASQPLGDRLLESPHWNRVIAVSAMLFIMFYAPCFVTVICIAKEAGTWKWAYFSMAFNTVFAFILSVAVYQIGMFLGLG
ncbi:MAG: ferrous iron transport protein B [Desulfobulbaceae bacterium]|uniref:Ferrous iron transport protein B n=1 Tax=Candidatus Desulfatifera sulfidica TaxID=2841691 RepID=A0A8J6T9L7_9BACT|nr:ferrous iron transport protein B [Candidatus Desulfatifera sulfidica]